MTSEQDKITEIADKLQSMLDRNEWHIEDAAREADREMETLAAYMQRPATEKNNAEMILAHAQRLHDAVTTWAALGAERRKLMGLLKLTVQE